MTPSVVSDISGISMPSVADEPKVQAGRKPGAKKIKKTKKAAGGGGGSGGGVVDGRVATRGAGSDSASKGSGSASRGSVYGNPGAARPSAPKAEEGLGRRELWGRLPRRERELSRTPSKAGLSVPRARPDLAYCVLHPECPQL